MACQPTTNDVGLNLYVGRELFDVIRSSLNILWIDTQGYGSRMIGKLFRTISMSKPGVLPLVKLPTHLVDQLKGAVEEAFRSLGNEAAVLIMYYARSRFNVAFNEPPVGVEDLDQALAEILGPARRMVVTQCAGLLNQRLGVQVPTKTEKLSDLFRQVEKLYQQQ